MELLDLPEECILHILEYLSLEGVMACTETCHRMQALSPSNMLWLPRLSDEFGIDVKITTVMSQDAEARSIYRQARQCLPETAIRFWGCFTDGGCDLNKRQYWMDHLFAPNSLESYCSAIPYNVHCVGLLADPQVCKATDQGQLTYRDYLMRRLRVPAGVVFGHGLMDLALIHGSEEVDSAVMQRLQANSLAELEHLFLEFYQELLQGNTLGRLLLHGLTANERESERAHMATVAATITRHIRETNDGFKVTPSDANALFDDAVLQSIDSTAAVRGGTLPFVGVLEKLTVSRAGHFSCPVLAGVIFVANCNPQASRFREEIKQGIMSVPAREICKAFDHLHDEDSVAEAVKRGALPPRTKHVACKAGSYFTFDPRISEAGPSGPACGAPPLVGPLRPVAWFKFHTRQEAKGLAAEPVTVWEERDPDLENPNSSMASRVAAPSNNAGPSGVGGAQGPCSSREEMVAPSQSATASSMLADGIDGQAWMGEGDAMYATDESGSDYELPSETPSFEDEFLDAEMEAQIAAMGEGSQQGSELDFGEEDEVEDDEEDRDVDGMPRGTKGRNLMEILLPSRVSGNLVLVKLINQEDLMHEWDDQHDEPNIDINHVIFSGRALHLPPGVTLAT